MQEKLYVPEPRTHLDLSIPGVKPIIACIGVPQDFGAGSLDEASKFLYGKLKNSLHVDYAGSPDILRKESFYNAGHNTYVISPVDSKDKFSSGLWNCTGIIVTGIDKNTDENISFMSHQDPISFFK